MGLDAASGRIHPVTTSAMERTAAPSARVSRSVPWVFFAIGTLVSAMFSWSVSLWNDEAITVSAAQRTLAELWTMLHNVDAVHGLYYMFMHFWIGPFGTSEFALRLPSALAIGASAAGVYLLTRRLADPRTAIIAGVVACTLPRLAWAGIEARPYAFTAAIAVWATIALLNASERGRAWRWAVYAVAAGIGILLNIYLALLVAAHAITVLIIHRWTRRLAAFVAAALASALIGATAVISAAGQTGQLGTLGPRDPLQIARLIVVNQFFLGETPSDDAVSPLFDTAWRIAGIAAAVVGIGMMLIALIRRPDGVSTAAHTRLLTVIVPWLALPPAVVAAYAITIAPLFQARYFTFTAPAAAVLVAVGWTTLRHPAARRALTAIYLLCIAVVYGSQRVPTAKAGSDWAAAAAYIDRAASHGDGIYFTPRYPAVDGVATWTARRMTYGYPEAFEGLDDLTLRTTGSHDGTLDGTSAVLEDVLPELRSHATVWVAYAPRYFDSIIDADRALLQSTGYHETTRRVGSGSILVRYERDGS